MLVECRRVMKEKGILQPKLDVLTRFVASMTSIESKRYRKGMVSRKKVIMHRAQMPDIG